MINREQLKQEIDSVNDVYLEILYRIIQAFKIPITESMFPVRMSDTNPLKGSVTFEGDLISPIDDIWDAQQ
jgi:hypothetical protein